MNKWQPISTAPIKPFEQNDWFRKASPYLLLWLGGRAAIGTYSYTQHGRGRWKAEGYVYHPTHWMAIPRGPVT